MLLIITTGTLNGVCLINFFLNLIKKVVYKSSNDTLKKTIKTMLLSVIRGPFEK